MSALARLPPKRPKAVLEELETLAQRARSGAEVSVPFVTVYLSSGTPVTGRFIAFTSDTREGAALVLHASETPRSLDALYVPLENITALMVHHSNDTLPVVSGGRIAPRPTEIPGRLVLDRQAAALATALSAKLDAPITVSLEWAALGTTDAARAAVTLVLGALGPVLDAILVDDLGRRSFRDRARAVRVTPAETRGAILEGRALVIQLEREGEELFAPDAELLRRALEAVL